MRTVKAVRGLVMVVACFLAAGDRRSAGEQPATSPGASVESNCVLLRNGNILVGHVLKQEDGYILRRDGATLHLAAYQVEAVCDDLPAAYAHRRHSTDPHEAVAHLKLAEWCLHQGLLEEAAGELEAARKLEPSHPRVPIVARRLEVAREPTNYAPSSARPANATDRGDGETPTPDTAQTVAAERDDPQRFAAYPEDTMEQFRRGVQPLLLNTCTTSGCHNASGEYSFVLDRRARWTDAPRELTIENLAAVLVQVNCESPLESPLLAAATTAHAKPLSSPPLAAESVSFGRLKQWVLHVCGHDQPTAEGPADAIAAHENEVEAAADSDDIQISEEELDALLSDEEAEAFRRQRSLRRPALPRVKGPADPYDPAEFNQRFSTKE